MSDNPYDTLGVKPDAPAEQIRGAYRRLARKLHPDLNPGDRAAEDRFKCMSAAYDLLGDPEKRVRFDNGGNCSRSPSGSSISGCRLRGELR